MKTFKGRSERFIENLLSGMSVRKSAIRAGYSENYADKKPKQLLAVAMRRMDRGDILVSEETKDVFNISTEELAENYLGLLNSRNDKVRETVAKNILNLRGTAVGAYDPLQYPPSVSPIMNLTITEPSFIEESKKPPIKSEEVIEEDQRARAEREAEKNHIPEEKAPETIKVGLQGGRGTKNIDLEKTRIDFSKG